LRPLPKAGAFILVSSTLRLQGCSFRPAAFCASGGACHCTALELMLLSTDVAESRAAGTSGKAAGPATGAGTQRGSELQFKVY